MKHLSLYNIGLWVASATFLLASLSLFLSPSLQKRIHNSLYPPQRVVLASLETDLNVQGLKYKVVKIKAGKEIWVEIYDLLKQDSQVISFKVNAKADGQMFVNNKTSPLFASDLNGDKVMEIIAPAFGLEFQPQIHAFQLDPTDGSFSKISNEKLIELL